MVPVVPHGVMSKQKRRIGRRGRRDKCNVDRRLAINAV